MLGGTKELGHPLSAVCVLEGLWENNRSINYWEQLVLLKHSVVQGLGWKAKRALGKTSWIVARVCIKQHSEHSLPWFGIKILSPKSLFFYI